MTKKQCREIADSTHANVTTQARAMLATLLRIEKLLIDNAKAAE